MWGLRKLGVPEWMAKQSAGFGTHYQAVAKTTGLRHISKEILAKRGLWTMFQTPVLPALKRTDWSIRQTASSQKGGNLSKLTAEVALMIPFFGFGC